MKKVLFIYVLITAIGFELAAQNQNIIGLNYSLGTSPDSDKFLYNGQYLGQYALGWYAIPGSAEARISGYGGIKLFTNGTNRLSILHNGNVGIGTESPDKKLTVNGEFKANNIWLTDNNNTIYKQGFGFGINSDRGYLFRQYWASDLGDFIEINNQEAAGGGTRADYIFRISGTNGFQFIPRENEAMRITNQGNVGIGTTSPQNKLEIKDNTGVGYNLVSIGDQYERLKIGSYIQMTSYPSSSGFISLRGYSSVGMLRNMIRVQNGSTGEPNVYLAETSGNVGIGTTTPGSWKLAVNGKIRAKEIQGETGWADFVFDKNYKLPTLEEVETHIQEKGHLKDIPSAEEVAENGILLGEMNAKLLQKIEELTLYTIKQEKRIKRLESKNENLKTEISCLHSLQQRLSNLEKELAKNN